MVGKSRLISPEPTIVSGNARLGNQIPDALNQTEIVFSV